jgi:hypothetical protein
MKSLFILALIAICSPAMADDGILVKFQRTLDLDPNNDAQARYVFTRFNGDNYQSTPWNVNEAMRGCYVNVPTQPNSRGVLEKDRQVRLVKSDGGEKYMPQYLMIDPASGLTVGNIQCFKHDWEEPNILLKIREYLDAVPVSGEVLRVPVKLETNEAEPLSDAVSIAL